MGTVEFAAVPDELPPIPDMLELLAPDMASDEKRLAVDPRVDEGSEDEAEGGLRG